MKILIAIETCHAFRERTVAQRDTWVKDVRGADVRFFVGRGVPEAVPLPDEVFLDVDDGYAGLPAKTQGICKWALGHGYDFVFKCDDDTYVQPERLLDSDFRFADYIGRLRGASGRWPAPYCSGFAYWLSTKAMKVVATAALTDDQAEDRWVANTLLSAGISPEADYRYQVVFSERNSRSGTEAPRQGNQVIAACEFEPDHMRAIHQLWLTEHSRLRPTLRPGRLDHVCVVIKTFLRDGYLVQALNGIEKHLPEVKIVVVDDGYESKHKIVLYSHLREKGHECIWLPFDSGFGAKSNAALKHCNREFVLIGCDDFRFDDPSVREGIERMVTVLEQRKDFGVASGRVDGNPYEACLDINDGRVIERRLVLADPSEVTGVKYYPCDLTVNYSLIRRSVLGLDKVHWDDDVRIGGGEHGSFFVDVKRSGWKVCLVEGANITTMPFCMDWQNQQYPSFRQRARQPERPCFQRRGIREWHLMGGGVEVCR